MKILYLMQILGIVVDWSIPIIKRILTIPVLFYEYNSNRVSKTHMQHAQNKK